MQNIKGISIEERNSVDVIRMDIFERVEKEKKFQDLNDGIRGRDGKELVFFFIFILLFYVFAQLQGRKMKKP